MDRIILRTIGFALLLAAGSVVAHAGDQKSDTPIWKKAAPGTAAYLGDDGGGVDTLTVCDTADHYRDWLNYEHPAGCQTFQSGLRATIEVVVFDPAEDTIRTSSDVISYPLVKIQIPARHFIGYLRLDTLHPIIPSGTIVHGKKIGEGSLQMYSDATIKDDDKGLDLGDEFSAKVIKYDPTKEDQYDLHVTILDGVHAGQSGWMLGSFLEDDRGELVDQFSKATAWEKLFPSAAPAHGTEMKCDTPGVAQMVIPDLFAKNPGAKKLGLEVTDITMLSVDNDGSGCIVSVKTNHGYSFKYRFQFSPEGVASLDMVP